MWVTPKARDIQQVRHTDGANSGQCFSLILNMHDSPVDNLCVVVAPLEGRGRSEMRHAQVSETLDQRHLHVVRWCSNWAYSAAAKVT